MEIHKSGGKLLKHLTINITESKWDRLKYLSASSGKTTSRFIQDELIKIIESGEVVAQANYEKKESYKVKSLAFTEDEFLKIKDYCKKNNIFLSRLIENLF